MAGVVALEIPPRRDQLALVRLVVTATATIDGRLTEARVEDLGLAVSEACANAFDAMAESGLDSAVVVTVDTDHEELAVTVSDEAGGFELAAVEPIPGATEPGRLGHERGLGIPLMRSLVDEVAFTRTDRGTAVRLSVRAPRGC